MYIDGATLDDYFTVTSKKRKKSLNNDEEDRPGKTRTDMEPQTNVVSNQVFYLFGVLCYLNHSLSDYILWYTGNKSLLRHLNLLFAKIFFCTYACGLMAVK